MTKRAIDIQLERLNSQIESLEQIAQGMETRYNERFIALEAKLDKQFDVIESNFAERLATMRRDTKAEVRSLHNFSQGRADQASKLAASLRSFQTGLIRQVETYVERVERESRKPLREAQAQIEMLKKQAPTNALESEDTQGLAAAQTLAIFDSIIFAISNWSTDGDTAPDFELMCQSVLFPTVYERVMSGDTDYAVTEVPISAPEVVRRGREFVKYFREVCATSLIHPESWEEHAHSVQKWWTNDALPLIYGGRSEEWDEDTPLSLVEALEWRDQPASRALHFPLIFDGLELVKKHGDIIRETTGLPEFNLNTLQTRLQP